jgi:hypothetical protein
VLDFTREQVADGLPAFAARADLPARVVSLPEQMELLDPLDGLTWRQIADVLAEALYTDGVPGSGSPQALSDARSASARILGKVCEALDGERITVARVCAALRAVLREDDERGGSVRLTADQVERLDGLFGEASRRQAEPVLAALEARLERLAAVGAGGGVGTDEKVQPLVSDASLEVIRFTARLDDLSSELLARVLIQALVAGAWDARPGTLMVAATDGLNSRWLERLQQVAEQRQVRVVYLFRHAREETAPLLGGGPTFLMQLGNTAEATMAAEFIGRDHRFVLSQFTVGATEGTSDSLNVGSTFQRSATKGWRSSSMSTSHSTNTSRTTGSSDSLADTRGRQRTYEFTVEPTALQTLPETAFIYIDPQRQGPTRATLGSCDLNVLTQPGVLDGPFPMAVTDG